MMLRRSLFVLLILCSLLLSLAPAQSRLHRAARSVPAVREIDFEGLKKLLWRDPKNAHPLLVNFWATWCEPCREEFPDLVKIDKDYRKKGLNFIAISIDDIEDIHTAVPKFLREQHATMPAYLLNVPDQEPAIKAVDSEWEGDMPATFLYDQAGNMVYKHKGLIKPAELRAEIDKLVSGNPAGGK